MPANRNYLWTETFVEALAHAGLKAVCIAPGSRSTPLAIAFYAHPTIKHYLHLDERSAAFFALGMAQAENQPVALVCTSGTAAAEFFPAIMEARQAGVPLLILTTDRPPELRYSGANQTVDQVKIYGDQVLWSVEAPLPESNPSALVIRSLQTLAARAVAKANGLEKGPVHINFPFRPPLEPTPVPSDQIPELGTVKAITMEKPTQTQVARPDVRLMHGTITLDTVSRREMLLEPIRQNERGLIVCGPRAFAEYPVALGRLAHLAGYPILAEPLSGARFGANSEAVIIGGYDNLPITDKPDLVIQFGAVPTSKALNTYLDQPEITRIMIKEDGVWADDTHRLALLLQADPIRLCAELADDLQATPRLNSAWEAQWRTEEAAWWDYLDSTLPELEFDGAILHDVVDLLPDDGLLFIGNSLPVRHLEEFARPAAKRVRVLGNRGASGIDGLVSSALGAGAALNQRVVLVIGDISLYHDMNGLLAIKHHAIPATIVLLNNDGGGIFQRLPIAAHEPPFTKLFRTPHGLNFAPVAQLYDLTYTQTTRRADFRAAFAASLAQGTGSALIEYTTDSKQDLEIRQQIKQRKELSNV